MKWYGISGSWRNVNGQVKRDVESVLEKIVFQGDGIVTGGALGVDYIATNFVLKKGNPDKQLKIFLPVKTEILFKHFLDKVKERVISEEQANMIISQLKFIKENYGNSIKELEGFDKACKESYYARNTLIVKGCDELYAFQVNDSKGTQDAIDKAKKFGKKIYLKKYYI